MPSQAAYMPMNQSLLRERVRHHHKLHTRNRVRLYAALYLIAAIIVSARAMDGIPRLFGTPMFACFLWAGSFVMYRWGHHATWTGDRRYRKKVSRSFLLALKTDPSVPAAFKASLLVEGSWIWFKLDNAIREFDERNAAEAEVQIKDSTTRDHRPRFDRA